jgi:hypothetical protein
VLGQPDGKCPETTLFKTLDAIYLDTASLLSVNDVPTKVRPTFLPNYLFSAHILVILIITLHLRVTQPRAWSL